MPSTRGRPYRNKKIDELESIYERSSSGADLATVQQLASELKKRKTRRSKKLLKKAQECLGDSSGPRESPGSRSRGQTGERSDLQGLKIPALEQAFKESPGEPWSEISRRICSKCRRMRARATARS